MNKASRAQFLLGLLIAFGSIFTAGCRTTPAKTAGFIDAEAADEVALANNEVSLTLDCSQGIQLGGLLDRRTGHEHLPPSDDVTSRPLLLYRYRDAGGVLQARTSVDGLRVRSIDYSTKKNQLEISTESTVLPLFFNFKFDIAPGNRYVVCGLRITYLGGEPIRFRVEWPILSAYQAPTSPGQLMGMAPIEIGGVAPLQDHPGIVLSVPPPTGLPNALNSMNLAAYYTDEAGGGAFAMALEPTLQRQELGIDADAITGRGVLFMDPGEIVELPPMAIGIHRGDWRAPLTDYRAVHQPQWNLPETPAWLREAGAIYCNGGSGAGAIYMTVEDLPMLKERIGHFDNLPRLLDEARRFGSDIVYLIDHHEGADEGDLIAYMNKGDYIPRTDMGGPEAFRRGVEAIHRRGGRVIVLVDPFIALRHSEVGRAHGEAWRAWQPEGDPYAHYTELFYTMDATNSQWQAHLCDVARMLVGEMGVDGIYLDSYGWQFNWPFRRTGEKRIRTHREWNRGVLETIDAIRETVRSINPESVVMTESFNEIMLGHVDGALDATFAWMAPLNLDQLIASPLRFAMPEANIFSNGRDLNQLHQVFAAGHSLALDPHWLPQAESIRPLVAIRRRYGDALVHGRLIDYWINPEHTVLAYLYDGSRHQVLTVVNTSPDARHEAIRLIHGATGPWQAQLRAESISGQLAPDGPIVFPLEIEPEGLRVLVRPKID